MKTCTKCGETKPLTEFHKRSDRKSGVVPQCKVCTSARNSAWQKANPDKSAANRLRYRRANREKVNAQNRAYLRANPEKARAFEANRGSSYWADPEKGRARVAAYRKGNPHVNWEAHYRERCRQFGVTPVVVSFTREDVVKQYGDACVYCDGGAFEEIDHYIPVAAGGEHTLETGRPSCRSCNRRKRNTTDRVLIRVYRAVADAIAGYLAA